MKKIFLAAIFLLTLNVHAQFNNVYPLLTAGTPTSSMLLDMDAESGSSWVLSTDVATRCDIQIKRIGFAGAVMAQSVYQFPAVNGVITPHAIINTGDGGCMVVGSAFEYLSLAPNASVNPFVARFDFTGSFMWMKILPTNPAPYYHGRVCRINIVHAEDGPRYLNYIIVTPGGDNYNLIDQSTCTINAIKINDVGSVIWNKIYGSNQPSVRRTPHALSCGKSTITVDLPGGGTKDSVFYKYFIAGVQEDHNASDPYAAFDMSIDENGDIVDQYRTYVVPDQPEGQDAIYDNQTEEFIMAYTIGYDNIMPSPVATATTVSKYAFSNLNINSTHCYYQPTAMENYGHSIVENISGDGYVIGCNIARDVTLVSVPGGGNRYPALLQIDKTGVPTLMTRFNKYDPDQVYRNPYLTKLKTPAGKSRYLLGSALCVTRGTPLPDHIRVISIDSIGKTCDAEDVPVDYNQMTWEPHSDPLPTFPRPNLEMLTFLTSPTSAVNPISCLHNGAAKLTTIEDSRIEIYPTLLEGTDHVVTLDISTSNTTEVSLTLYDLYGKKLAEKYIANINSAQKPEWNMPLLLPGTYIITVYSPNENLQKTIKISKL